MLEFPFSSRYLSVASALNCSASSISDNYAGPGLAAPKICCDVCTDILAEHWLALAWLISSSPSPVHWGEGDRCK